MKKIDCGSLNKKQLNRVIEEVRKSDLKIIEVHILKIQKEMSMILEFRNENERIFFDKGAEKLVKNLKKLRGSL